MTTQRIVSETAVCSYPHLRERYILLKRESFVRLQPFDGESHQFLSFDPSQFTTLVPAGFLVASLAVVLRILPPHIGAKTADSQCRLQRVR
jgi:hypothetical protein